MKLKPDKEIKLITGHFHKSFKESRSDICLHPECSGKAINSHSISQVMFRRVFKNADHVYTLGVAERKQDTDNGIHPISPGNIKNYNHEVIKIIALKKSVGKQASTFMGFCNPHDKNLFSPLDADNFSVYDIGSIFLQSYRTICCELKRIEDSLNLLKNLAKGSIARGDHESLTSTLLIDCYEKANEYKYKREIKELFDKALLLKEYQSLMLSVVRDFYFSFDFLFSGMPDIEEFNNIRVEKNIIINILKLGNKGYIVFSFIKPLMTEEDLLFILKLQTIDFSDLSDFVSKIVLDWQDGFYFSINHWESFPNNKKQKIGSPSFSVIYNRLIMQGKPLHSAPA